VTIDEARRLAGIERTIDAAEPAPTAAAASRFPMDRSPFEGVATARNFDQEMMAQHVAERDAADKDQMLREVLRAQ
jgi:hypothetical protein